MEWRAHFVWSKYSTNDQWKSFIVLYFFSSRSSKSLHISVLKSFEQKVGYNSQLMRQDVITIKLTLIPFCLYSLNVPRTLSPHVYTVCLRTKRLLFFLGWKATDYVRSLCFNVVFSDSESVIRRASCCSFRAKGSRNAFACLWQSRSSSWKHSRWKP